MYKLPRQVSLVSARPDPNFFLRGESASIGDDDDEKDSRFFISLNLKKKQYKK